MIALLTVFAITVVAWAVTQWAMGENATVPLRIARQRTVAFATFYIFFGSASFVLLVYYLPIWSASFRPRACRSNKTSRFQAIKGDTAAESGIHNLATVLSVGELPYITL